MSVDLFATPLTNLVAILEKAQAHALAKKIDPAVLVNARLAPDMLPLSKQVQIASDMSKGAVARLAGLAPPVYEDKETTFEELKARLMKTVEYLKSIPASAYEGAEDRDISIQAGPNTLQFKGLDYLQRFAIPNVYFHVTTAYCILRHNGVEIGKRDYLG
jgi:hypothetical protein